MGIFGTIGASILLIDDVEEVRDGIARLLGADGYEVDAARSEASAVAAALRHPPHLLLLDLDGPPAVVIELGKRIRHLAKLAPAIPIVVFGPEEIDGAAPADTADNIHVVNPRNFSEVRDCIGRLLATAPPASATEEAGHIPT